MKKTLLIPVVSLFFILLMNSTAFAQNLALKIVPNPDAGAGYSGGAVTYNNKLYFIYRSAANGTQLAQYDDSAITLIPNPVSGGVQGTILVYNNLLYLEYYNRPAGVYQLATFDGTSIVLIPNPDATNASFSFVAIYKNKLCIEYNEQLGVYDGTKWTLFNPPSAGGFTFQGDLTVYGDNLYMGYQTTANVRQMMKFDGNSLTLIPNPDGATAFNPFGGGYQGVPIIYNNTLYIKYVAITGVTHLAAYDGTTLTLVPNPDASTSDGYGYGLSGGWPIVFNSKLYFQYASNITNEVYLTEYDGTNFKLIPNPDAGAGFQGAPIVYDTAIYMQYYSAANVYQLAKFDGTSLTLIPNPQGSPSGYANYTSTGAEITTPIVAVPFFNPTLFNVADLFIQYRNTAGFNQLGVYNDSTLKLVLNPDSSKQSGGYVGSPVIYNNKLYVEYGVASGLSYNLAYLFDSSSVLPVNLLNFTAQQKGSDNLLQWQTATEINSNYFNVQRSLTGRDFINIGKVNAAGNSTALINYAYTDPMPAGTPPVIYYRLQQVDKNGRAAYSNVAVIHTNGNSANFSILPNPVKNVINLYSAIDVYNAGIVLTDMSGKILYAGKHNLQAGGITQIAAAALSSGMYIITINNNNTQSQLKVIKGE